MDKPAETLQVVLPAACLTGTQECRIPPSWTRGEHGTPPKGAGKDRHEGSIRFQLPARQDRDSPIHPGQASAYMILVGGSCLAMSTISLGLQSWLGSSATLPQAMQTKLMCWSFGLQICRGSFDAVPQCSHHTFRTPQDEWE
jgi:hypothetical protein